MTKGRLTKPNDIHQSTLIGSHEKGTLVAFKLFVRVTAGAECFFLRPERRLRATMTGTEDLVTR